MRQQLNRAGNPALFLQKDIAEGRTIGSDEMTEIELRQSVLDKAKLWLACKEADGSHRKIIDKYNEIRPLPRGYRVTYTDAWCATFVSAAGFAAGLSDIIYPECGCEPMIRLYKNHGRWVEDDNYMPQRGDVVFYDWQDSGAGDCTGTADHVGLVWSAYNDAITVIEGNNSDMVRFRDIKRNGRYIRGYGLPDYASKADSVAAPPVVAPEERKTELVPLPVLMIGDGGEDSDLEEAVRAMQHMLEKRGFKCGWTGADGDFGQKTESALGKFQAAYGLEHDGICKGKDWAVLILGVNKHE